MTIFFSDNEKNSDWAIAEYPSNTEYCIFVLNKKKTPQPMAIQKSSFDFLKKIQKNNNKEWFTKNKSLYLEAKADMESYIDAVNTELSKTDEIEKAKLYRIYRDVRFSKDKTPYKSHFALSLTRATAYRRGGYFIRLAPGASFVGGGFYSPDASDLKHIRQQIAADSTPLRKILKSKKFKDTFGELMGDKLKTSPKGFDKDHPDIDLLRYKSFYTFHNFSDSEVLSPNFVKETVKVLKAIRPYFDYMSDILTHDLNGISLLDK